MIEPLPQVNIAVMHTGVHQVLTFNHMFFYLQVHHRRTNDTAKSDNSTPSVKWVYTPITSLGAL